MTAQFLPGLPGTGPEPIHFYIKRPTPWSEGAVVQFSGLTRPDWVANLQTGDGYATKIVRWHNANAVIIVANGAVYFIRSELPDEWRCYGSLGIDCAVTPDGENAVIATDTDLILIDVNGDIVWHRRMLAIDGLEIGNVTNDEIDGRLCYDPPDGWSSFAVNRSDGNDA